jgi:K+-sensing histidine kinase KdpD
VGGRLRNILLVAILFVSCALFIIVGQTYWQKKINRSIEQAIAEEKESTQAANTAAVTKYASNLPPEVQEKIKTAIHKKKQVRLLIVGSNALSSADQDSWPDLLAHELDETYGKGVFVVTVKEYGKTTTRQARETNLDEEIIQSKPDILLWEPFILNNNGIIAIEDTLDDIETMIKNITKELPDVTVMLQPPHPIYNATYYPEQVKLFQAFAKEKGYIYIDHWEAWPDYQSEKLNKYVDPDTDLPTKDGQQRWADFLIDYFIAK